MKYPSIYLYTDEKGIEVSWSSISGAEGYRIYRKTGDEDYTLIQTTADTSWIDESVESGTTYTYQVYAYADSTISAGSAEKSKMYLEAPEITEVCNGSYGVKLTWKEVEGAERYYIYYKSSTASGYSYNYVYAGSEETLSAQITAVSSGSSYEFYIKAYGGSTYSLQSETFSILYLKAPTVTLTTDDGGNQLSWSAITGAESYAVYRKTADSEYELVKTTADTAWTDATIEDGVTYTYQVYAYADGVYSGGSTEKSGGRTLISDCTITLSATSYTYNGSAKTPTVTVKYGSTKLTNGTHYTVSYTDNVNAGTATVTITGIGVYAGTTTETFTINKASQTVTASLSSSSIACEETSKITVSAIGTITYTSADTSIALVSEDGVVTGVATGNTTITVTASGNSNYKSASATVDVTVGNIQTITVTDTMTLTYGDSGKSLGATCLGGATLTYTSSDTSVVSVTSAGKVTAVGVGTATITIKAAATDSYAAATATVTVTVNAKDISNCRMVFSKVGDITKANLYNYILLIDGDTILEEDEDYWIWGSSYGYGSDNVILYANFYVEGCGNYTGEASFEIDPITTASVLESASKISTGIKLTWQQETGAVGYKIYRKTDSGSYSLVKTITKNSTTSWTDTDISNNTKYTYYIKAYTLNSSGYVYAGNSNTKSVTVGLDTPTIKSVANTTSGVKITWGKVTNATGYYVYRATSSGGTYKKIATIKSGSTVSYTNSTSGTNAVSGGKNYYYKVYAYNSNGTSKASSAKNIRYLKAGTISSLTNTSSGITVKWSKVSGATGYYIYRKAGSGSYSKVKTITSASTVSWTDTAVKSKNGTTYTYYVQAYYKSGSTTYNSSYTAKKTVRLAAVALSSVKNSSSKKMTVKWAKNSKATGYQIQYSTSSSFASGNKTVTVSSASTVSKVISSLTKGKTYYVRVRAYKTVSGTKYYSAWSSKKSVKISK